MDLDVVFLGTAGSMPTADRSPTALLVRRGGERLLFDCAEGTQRQLLRSTLGLIDLREVFLTHYHADHYLGLPGMLKTFALRGREVPITIYGPAGPRRPVRLAAADLRPAHLPVRARGARSPGETLDRDDYRLVTFPVEHGVSSIGYALVEDDRPGGSTSRPPTRSASRSGPSAAPLQRGEAVTLADGTTVTPEQVLGAGADRPHGRDPRRHGAGRDGPRGRARRRPARPRGDLPRGRARARRRDDALDRARRGRARARRRRQAARAHAPLDAVLRARRRARGARRSSPRRSFRGTSISSTSRSRSGVPPQLSRVVRVRRRRESPVPVTEETAR